MSYEGYEQVLCENGHYFTFDCYTWDFYGGLCDDWKCPTCGAPIGWCNSVDTTNEGYVNDDGSVEPAYGYVEVKLKKQSKCEHCGSILEQVYDIEAAKEDTKKVREWTGWIPYEVGLE